MCGISFYFSKDKPYDMELRESLRLTSHRGPDSSGTYFKETKNGFLGLGHNRLSIIDLSSSGAQPMVTGDIRIIFNGEIYNYKEIRQNLISRGYSFDTSTDTEVILKSYAELEVIQIFLLKFLLLTTWNLFLLSFWIILVSFDVQKHLQLL